MELSVIGTLDSANTNPADSTSAGKGLPLEGGELFAQLLATGEFSLEQIQAKTQTELPQILTEEKTTKEEKNLELPLGEIDPNNIFIVKDKQPKILQQKIEALTRELSRSNLSTPEGVKLAEINSKELNALTERMENLKNSKTGVSLGKIAKQNQQVKLQDGNQFINLSKSINLKGQNRPQVVGAYKQQVNNDSMLIKSNENVNVGQLLNVGKNKNITIDSSQLDTNDIKLETILNSHNKGEAKTQMVGVSKANLSNIVGQTNQTSSSIEVINKISDYITQIRNSSDNNLNVEVNHEKLGKMSIQVTRDSQNALDIKILVGNQDAHDFISKSRSQLVAKLHSSGLQIHDFKIDVGPTLSTLNDFSGGNKGSSQDNFAQSQNGQYNSKEGEESQESQKRRELWEFAKRKRYNS